MYGYWVKPDGSLIDVYSSSEHVNAAWEDMGKKPNYASGYGFAFEQGWVRVIAEGTPPAVDYNGIPKITPVQAKSIAEIMERNPSPSVYVRMAGQEGYVNNKRASLQLILTGAKPIPKENRFSVVVADVLTPAEHGSNWYHALKISLVD